jgi:iron-sulfur cluster repair protein YtfE (RIC family)
MKREKKGNVATPSRHLDPESERGIQEFADLFVESMRDQYKKELEPFEVYAQKIRSQLHENIDEFRARIAHGYDILLQELSTHTPHRKDS